MTATEKYNINQELKTIAPILSKIKKPIHHNVPDGYFDQLEDQIMSQINILNHDKTKLHVPEGYFETVEDQILNIVTDQRTKVIPIFKKPFFRIVIAASVVFMLAFISYQLFQKDADTHQDTFVDLQADEIEYFQYLHQNVDDLDINMLIDNDLVDESDLFVLSYNDISETDESASIFESAIDF